MLDQYYPAVKDLNRSLELRPSQKAFANRGLAYALLNMHDRAITEYSKSLEINSNDAEVLYYRGLSYGALKMEPEACGDLKRIKEMNYAGANEVLTMVHCIE